MPKRDHVLAQPMMVVVLGCAKTGPVLAQPLWVVLGCAKVVPGCAKTGHPKIIRKRIL